MMNKRGDRRGVNGKNAKRGPGGRFKSRQSLSLAQSAASAPEQPTIIARVPTSHRAHDTLSHKEPRVAAASRSTPTLGEIDELAIEFDAAVSPVRDLFVYHHEEEEEEDPHKLRVVARHTPTPPALAPAARRTPIPQIEQLDFDSATNAASLGQLTNKPELRSKPRNPAYYNDWVQLQCCKDRRDVGSVYTHVVDVNVTLPAMHNFVKFFSGTAVRVSVVRSADVDILTDLAKIFCDRNLFGAESTDSVVHDMVHVYSRAPFYTLTAVRDGVTVGGAVIRAHRLNNDERLIQIELIASVLRATPGVGTTLMRVLRSLSQVSSVHTGHVVAFTLKTKEAIKFYERKLPELGPSARAFLYSISLLDSLATLPRHLEMRSVTVPSI